MSVGIHTAKTSHVLKGKLKNRKTMLDAIKIDCEELKLNACQIFVQGPRNSKMNKMDYNEIKSYCKNKIKLYVHSSYISVGIFSVNSANKKEEKSKNAISVIENQLKACDKLDALGLVIHISKRTPVQIAETFKTIEHMLKKYKTPILLEMPAKKPDDDKTYETFTKINTLTDTLCKKIPKLNWGWCIDTAHLYSSGIDLNKPDIIHNWIKGIIQAKYIKLLHLNGIANKLFNTGKDTHEVVFSKEDAIFRDNIMYTEDAEKKEIEVLENSAITHLQKFCKKNNIDVIMEINKSEYNETIESIEIIRNLFQN